ncbi:MAG TPA: hypothetical protein DEV93_18890 [Chloroflexi bacterium]|jgi:Predicted membrane protein (DUF2232)|nr:hypothetical protein [Chloroflexota bacterium]
MTEEVLLRRRSRTHAIVEGALLGDIAIVFLLMRVYLPLPVVRTLLRTIASVPFVMLVQRRGLRVAILAAIASYILFSALVGPLLGLSAIDIAVAGILIGLGRKAGLPTLLNTLWAAVAYAILDLIIPTILSVIIFRFPVHQLIDAARHFIRLLFNFAIFVMKGIGAPSGAVHTLKGWEGPAVSHWQISWIVTTIFLGFLNVYLVALVSDMVLNQIPEETLATQRAA